MAPVAIATIVVIPLAIVAVSIIPVPVSIIPVPVSIIPVSISMIPVAPGPLTPGMIAPGMLAHLLRPLDDVARLVGVEMVMLMLMLMALMIKVRLQIGFAAAARIGEPVTAIVLKAVTSQRALDVGACIFPLGACGSRHGR
jgi:hypothetical protein